MAKIKLGVIFEQEGGLHPAVVKSEFLNIKEIYKNYVKTTTKQNAIDRIKCGDFARKELMIVDSNCYNMLRRLLDEVCYFYVVQELIYDKRFDVFTITKLKKKKKEHLDRINKLVDDIRLIGVSLHIFESFVEVFFVMQRKVQYHIFKELCNEYDFESYNVVSIYKLVRSKMVDLLKSMKKSIFYTGPNIEELFYAYYYYKYAMESAQKYNDNPVFRLLYAVYDDIVHGDGDRFVLRQEMVDYFQNQFFKKLRATGNLASGMLFHTKLFSEKAVFDMVDDFEKDVYYYPRVSQCITFKIGKYIPSMVVYKTKKNNTVSRVMDAMFSPKLGGKHQSAFEKESKMAKEYIKQVWNKKSLQKKTNELEHFNAVKLAFFNLSAKWDNTFLSPLISLVKTATMPDAVYVKLTDILLSKTMLTKRELAMVREIMTILEGIKNTGINHFECLKRLVVLEFLHWEDTNKKIF